MVLALQLKNAARKPNKRKQKYFGFYQAAISERLLNMFFPMCKADSRCIIKIPVENFLLILSK
jgi:hypothetical protein